MVWKDEKPLIEGRKKMLKIQVRECSRQYGVSFFGVEILVVCLGFSAPPVGRDPSSFQPDWSQQHCREADTWAAADVLTSPRGIREKGLWPGLRGTGVSSTRSRSGKGRDRPIPRALWQVGLFLPQLLPRGG